MLEIRIPATTANIGPGFDSLGFAVKLYNLFKIEKISRGIESVIIDKKEKKKLDLSIEENLFYQAIEKVYNKAGYRLDGLKLIEEVNIPFARGLGSSATAVVAGLLGANIILDNPFGMEDLINMAVEMEGHPDNVLPAFLGGFVINVMDKNGLTYKKIELNQELKFVFVIPDFKLKTDEVRRVLPDKVNFSDAVYNLSRTALLVSCLQDNDFSNLKTAMGDKLHQDYRANLIPGFYQVIESAYQEGALGCALSGAGPTIMAIVKDNAEQIGKEMVRVFNGHNIESSYIITEAENQGYFSKEEGW